MDDKEFFEMQLKTLFPSAGGWPADYVHQRALLGAVNEATTLARDAEAEFRKIDNNRDLTPEARKRHKAELVMSISTNSQAHRHSPAPVKPPSTRSRSMRPRLRAISNQRLMHSRSDCTRKFVASCSPSKTRKSA